MDDKELKLRIETEKLTRLVLSYFVGNGPVPTKGDLVDQARKVKEMIDGH